MSDETLTETSTEYSLIPPLAMSGESVSVTLMDLLSLVNDIQRDAPDYFYVHPKTVRQLFHWHALSRIYVRHRAPHRKLRKCHERRRLAAIRVERRRLTRQERRDPRFSISY